MVQMRITGRSWWVFGVSAETPSLAHAAGVNKKIFRIKYGKHTRRSLISHS
jgi:hypothetical protein